MMFRTFKTSSNYCPTSPKLGKEIWKTVAITDILIWRFSNLALHKWLCGIGGALCDGNTHRRTSNRFLALDGLLDDRDTIVRRRRLHGGLTVLFCTTHIIIWYDMLKCEWQLEISKSSIILMRRKTYLRRNDVDLIRRRLGDASIVDGPSDWISTTVHAAPNDNKDRDANRKDNSDPKHPAPRAGVPNSCETLYTIIEI